MDFPKKETTTPTLRALLQNIKDAEEIADKLEFDIILDGGLLLGMYRDGGVIKGDEDDVDFAVPYEVVQFKLKEVIEEFQAKGFELFRLRDTVATFKRDGVKIDFLFYKEFDKKHYYLTLYHQKKPFALKVPKWFWDKRGTVKFEGLQLLSPHDIERYLEWRFGDWKTPILRPAFSFANYLTKPKLTHWL